MDITTIGFDLAKTVFQVHGADGEGRVVLRRKLRRGKVLAFFAGLPSCLVGMEACASAHYWLLARRPTNVVLVAMANKTTRVAWALLRYERIYRPTHA